MGRRAKISGNTDFQSAVPQISQLLENLQSTKQHLNQLWVVKKMRLEQCLQLRIFEEDVEKVGVECGLLNLIHNKKKNGQGWVGSWTRMIV